MLLSSLLPLTPKLLDFILACTTIIAIRSKWKDPNRNEMEKELLNRIDKKDEEIMQLRIEIQAWQMHHEQLTNKDTTCN